MNPPCYGQAELFDSVEVADHEEARDICAGCPVKAACADALQDAKRQYGNGAPDGTWAGVLYKNGRQVAVKVKSTRSARIAAEDAAYTDVEARRAKAAYMRGRKDPWVMAGYRVYKRRWAKERAAA